MIRRLARVITLADTVTRGARVSLWIFHATQCRTHENSMGETVPPEYSCARHYRQRWPTFRSYLQCNGSGSAFCGTPGSTGEYRRLFAKRFDYWVKTVFQLSLIGDLPPIVRVANEVDSAQNAIVLLLL